MAPPWVMLKKCSIVYNVFVTTPCDTVVVYTLFNRVKVD
jgi:hypothetical protein